MDEAAERIASYLDRPATSYLDLSGIGLTEVPQKIADLVDLTSLNLSNNQLTDVAGPTQTLVALQVLNLTGNPISTEANPRGRRETRAHE